MKFNTFKLPVLWPETEVKIKNVYNRTNQTEI
jgi:hypothetical protein